MVKINKVTKLYGKNSGPEVRALDGVSLDIEKGSFVAIVGASGSGKSTLMNILGLLDRPSSGSYTLDGSVVSDLTDDEAAYIRNRKIGFVFQSFNLLPRTTAKENVELPLVYSAPGESHLSAPEVLASVGLDKRMDHFPSQMSGGEQQRVAIARALINDPEFILADEPTGNLDSKATDEVMRIFEDLNRDGRTIVLITHEPEIAARAQRVVRIADGKIENKG